LQFISLTELAFPDHGYLVDDTLEVEAQVMLWNDMESADTEAISFDVRGEVFKVLKSSLQAYPDSLLCKLADDTASDGAVLARSTTGDEPRKPIAIDRDPALFKQVLITSMFNTPSKKIAKAEAALLWAELDFYGLMPQLKGGELSAPKGKRTMLPAALLRHESASGSAKKARLRAELVDTRKALQTKSNTEIVSLIVSQMSELVSRKLLLTGAHDAETFSEAREAVLRAVNPDGADWSTPFEQRFKLASVPSASAFETKQSFVIITCDDGQPQVLSADNPSTLPEECSSRPPKVLPAEMQTLLKTHLAGLDYTVTLDNNAHSGGVAYSRITVSW
jgi:hypothetical protein